MPCCARNLHRRDGIPMSVETWLADRFWFSWTAAHAELCAVADVLADRACWRNSTRLSIVLKKKKNRCLFLEHFGCMTCSTFNRDWMTLGRRLGPVSIYVILWAQERFDMTSCLRELNVDDMGSGLQGPKIEPPSRKHVVSHPTGVTFSWFLPPIFQAWDGAPHKCVATKVF